MRAQSRPAGISQGKCVFGCTDTSNVEKNTDQQSAALKSPVVPPPIASAPVNVIPLEYFLGPEDVIDVSVWKNENLSKTVLIRPDGKISLPLIGDVQAAGLTTVQLRDSIKLKLKEYKETPEVSIIVREINSLVVFVTGEVTHPGKLMLRSDTSLLQAISLAGGFTQYASKNSIVLLRRVGGSETRKVIRYSDIVSGKKPEDDILLQRGDTIVVP
jgi:polysaccharide export outer membrane protein